MRLRNAFVGNEKRKNVLLEVYWKEGFMLCFDEKAENKETLITLQILSEENGKPNDHISIEISSNLSDIQPILQSIHISMKKFIQKWVVLDVCDKVKVVLIKNLSNKSKRMTVFKTKLGNNTNEISTNYSEISGSSAGSMVSCANCGLMITLNERIEECKNCLSDNHCFEREYSLVSVLGVGK